MGHGTRMLNQGFHAAQRLGQGKHFRGTGKLLCRFESGCDLHGDHASESAMHLSCGNLVAWMGFQSRVPYAFHFRAGFQPLRHLHGVTTVLLDAQIQRFEATNVKPGVERRWHSSGRVLQERHFIADFPVVEHHRSADHVGMAADVFGGGIYDHVGAIRQRMLQYRGCEGVVHHHFGAMRVSDR